MRQVLLAASLGLVVTLFGTPVAIRALVRQGYGQLIRDDGPTSHHTKRGTPTMGGIAIVGAVVAGYFIGHVGPDVSFSRTGLLVLLTVAIFAVIGALDGADIPVVVGGIIPEADVPALKAAGVTYEGHIYEGAGHGFNCDRRANFRPDAAEAALNRTLALFAEHLK